MFNKLIQMTITCGALLTSMTSHGAVNVVEVNKQVDHAVVQRFVFQGNQEIRSTTLQKLTAKSISFAMTLAEMDAIARQVEDFYVKRGYKQAVAVIPEQSILDGVVVVSITEGTRRK